PSQTDVFVIGGGPAGLAAAIAARKRGFEVVVADGAQPPIDKACGEGVMPDGVAALARLGVAATINHGFPFHGIRADTVYVDIKTQGQVTWVPAGTAERHPEAKFKRAAP